jgi:hypothetical protein
MNPYHQKLKDPRWQKKRLEVLNRDDFKCQKCGDVETELNVHHIKYSTNEPWDEPASNLITLCKDCHSIIENYKAMDKSITITRIQKLSRGLHRFVAFVYTPKTIDIWVARDIANWAGCSLTRDEFNTFISESEAQKLEVMVVELSDSEEINREFERDENNPLASNNYEL